MKKNPFKRFPVVILPDDCGEYVPGQPLPPGATLNTPLPAWVFVVALVALAAIIYMVLPKDTASDAVGRRPAAALAHVEPTLESLVEVSFVQFTPAPKIEPTSTRPQAPQATPEPTPVLDLYVTLRLDPEQAQAGTIVAVLAKSSINGVMVITLGNKFITNGEVYTDREVATTFMIPPDTPSGEHTIWVDVVAANAIPERYNLTLEVIP